MAQGSDPTSASLERLGGSTLIPVARTLARSAHTAAQLLHPKRQSMMCWSWIDSSRKREALTISCPGPGIASLRRCKAGPGQKIAKTTPCKVEWTPARSTLAALRPGQKKGPNLISSRSSPHQTIYCPPLIVSVEPVMAPAWSAARNTTARAISSGSPRRPTGINGRMLFSSTSFGTACTISVLI
jgi:hypothetical protein